MYRIAPFLIFVCLLAGPLCAAEAEREFKAGEDILEAWRFAGSRGASPPRRSRTIPSQPPRWSSTAGLNFTKAAIKKR